MNAIAVHTADRETINLQLAICWCFRGVRFILGPYWSTTICCQFGLSNSEFIFQTPYVAQVFWDIRPKGFSFQNVSVRNMWVENSNLNKNSFCANTLFAPIQGPTSEVETLNYHVPLASTILSCIWFSCGFVTP